MKSVNASARTDRDMGGDGYDKNPLVAKDAIAYTLDYYRGDYKPVESNPSKALEMDMWWRMAVNGTFQGGFADQIEGNYTYDVTGNTIHDRSKVISDVEYYPNSFAKRYALAAGASKPWSILQSN